jgi:hypothetical protein
MDSERVHGQHREELGCHYRRWDTVDRGQHKQMGNAPTASATRDRCGYLCARHAESRLQVHTHLTDLALVLCAAHHAVHDDEELVVFPA